MFDTHAHLTDDRLRNELPDVLQRAKACGVEHVVCVATTSADSRGCIAVAHQFGPHVIASVGIQPNNVAEAAPNDWDEIVKLVTSPGVVAIGETGLDRYWDRAPFPQQELFFAKHLTLSRKHNLPVIIHCREAEADVVRMLRADFDRHGPVRGVMHSFTGDWPTAEVCLAMGLYISFAGMVTYKNAQNLRDIAVRVPSERLLVETDAPYLAPVPFRGKRNESAYVEHTLACLAEVRGVAKDELDRITTANARNLFGIRPSL